MNITLNLLNLTFFVIKSYKNNILYEQTNIYLSGKIKFTKDKISTMQLLKYKVKPTEGHESKLSHKVSSYRTSYNALSF